MNRMRKSLYYPAFYLTTAGLGSILMPELFMKMMFSNTSYDLNFIRFTGLFFIGLAVLVIQVIRNNVTVMYPTLIGVRVFFCAGYVALYAATGNPFFLTVLAIVGAGVIASSVSFAKDRP
jgi:hypothetical protein